MSQPLWWTDAVVYQVYVRSFADSDGDGIGDLPGITSRLPYLRDLGVDALWITPFYTSPQHDHGYDVADYRDVDPLFGSLADADALLAAAHDLGLRVIVDLVPNHTSSAHAWFQAALPAEPGSAERARYLFRDGQGASGAEPPNNWQSVFGGPAWTRVEDAGQPGQWYLHLFDTTQPDLDWRNPEVGEMFVDVLRFWLDRGVDGFRVDVAHGLYKEASLRDQVLPEKPENAVPKSQRDESMVERTLSDEPMWDQPEVHEVYRLWNQVLADYPGDRMNVAEAWTQTPESMAKFVRPDEMSQAFNFSWLLADWSASAFADVVTGTFDALAEVDASPTWVLSNHDVVRHVTRYGGGAVGLARGRAATLTMLALPGIVVPLPGRGARPRAGRRRARGPPGPLVAASSGGRWRGGPRRMPGADPVVGRDRAVRIRTRRRPAVDPATGRLDPPERRGADRRRGLDAGVLPGGAARTPGAAARHRRRGDGRGRRADDPARRPEGGAQLWQRRRAAAGGRGGRVQRPR